MLITVNIVNTSQKVAFRYKNILQIFACFVLGWTVCFPLKNVRSHWKLWDFYQMIWFKNQTKPNFRAGKKISFSVYTRVIWESQSSKNRNLFFLLSLFVLLPERDRLEVSSCCQAFLDRPTSLQPLTHSPAFSQPSHAICPSCPGHILCN